MTALCLIPLMIFAAFGVDLASWHARVSFLQKSADAAALAGTVWMPDLVARDHRRLRRASSERGRRHRHLPRLLRQRQFTVDIGRGSTATSLRVDVTDPNARRYFSQVFRDEQTLDPLRRGRVQPAAPPRQPPQLLRRRPQHRRQHDRRARHHLQRGLAHELHHPPAHEPELQRVVIRQHPGRPVERRQPDDQPAHLRRRRLLRHHRVHLGGRPRRRPARTPPPCRRTGSTARPATTPATCSTARRAPTGGGSPRTCTRQGAGTPRAPANGSASGRPSPRRHPASLPVVRQGPDPAAGQPPVPGQPCSGGRLVGPERDLWLQHHQRADERHVDDDRQRLPPLPLGRHHHLHHHPVAAQQHPDRSQPGVLGDDLRSGPVRRQR